MTQSMNIRHTKENWIYVPDFFLFSVFPISARSVGHSGREGSVTKLPISVQWILLSYSSKSEIRQKSMRISSDNGCQVHNNNYPQFWLSKMMFAVVVISHFVKNHIAKSKWPLPIFTPCSHIQKYMAFGSGQSTINYYQLLLNHWMAEWRSGIVVPLHQLFEWNNIEYSHTLSASYVS